MDLYKRTHETLISRVVWFHDYTYKPVGDEELAGLESGWLIALCASIEARHGGQWESSTLRWGIIARADEDLEELGSKLLDIPADGGRD